MDIADVMDAVADQLSTIVGLRVHASPPGAIQPPAAVVSFPERIDFDATYGRGMDVLKLPVVLAVGRPTDRVTRDAMAGYCAGSGDTSLKAVLEDGVYTAFDTVRVASVDFDVVTIGAVDYMAAVFSLEISGSGS
jgi:hypothetical protein